MRDSPRNIRLAFNQRGLTHFGGIYCFHEFLRVLQFRNGLAQRLSYARRPRRYSLSQMVLALIYPIVLGLDRIEAASFLRSNGTFQDLTGLSSFPDPQTLRRFLLQAPPRFWEQLHGVNDRLLQNFIYRPDPRSRLTFDLDSTVVTVFGHQGGAEIGYNPRYRGQRSYNPLLCIEAQSSSLWDAELRAGNAGTGDGSVELLETCFANVPPDIREIRARADAGFGFDPVFQALESWPAQYAVVASLTPAFRRLLPGWRYEPVNTDWAMADFEHRSHGWPNPRRFGVARRFMAEQDPQPTLFTLGRYIYRAWVTNLPLTPAGVWHFYDARAARELRIRELREDFALPKIPTRSFQANALSLEIVRLASNLVTAFQRTCLPSDWQSLTLQKLRFQLFLLPGEITRPQNRPVLRLKDSPFVEKTARQILARTRKLKPLRA
jgi:hypothetical protein